MSEERWFPTGFLEAHAERVKAMRTEINAAPSPSPVVEVSEEMVEAALDV